MAKRAAITAAPIVPTKIKLTTKATVPGIDKETFDTIAKKAKEGCPVSRVLKGAEITLDAQLV